jgi:hypothetical protein
VIPVSTLAGCELYANGVIVVSPADTLRSRRAARSSARDWISTSSTHPPSRPCPDCRLSPVARFRSKANRSLTAGCFHVQTRCLNSQRAVRGIGWEFRAIRRSSACVPKLHRDERIAACSALTEKTYCGNPAGVVLAVPDLEHGRHQIERQTWRRLQRIDPVSCRGRSG